MVNPNDAYIMQLQDGPWQLKPMSSCDDAVTDSVPKYYCVADADNSFGSQNQKTRPDQSEIRNIGEDHVLKIEERVEDIECDTRRIYDQIS